MEEFENIAETASESAAAVQCGVEDYQMGLRVIIERLQVDLQASRETS